MNAALPLLVDLVIALTVLEGVVLVGWWRTGRGGVPPRDFVRNMASGLFLMAALHGAVRQAGADWVLPCLVAAGAAHLFDLRARWRTAATTTSRSFGATP